MHDRNPANLHKTLRPTATERWRRTAGLLRHGHADERDHDRRGLLKQRGYHTIHIGKWHLGDSNGAAPTDQGFDESLYMASGKYLPDDDPECGQLETGFRPHRPLPLGEFPPRRQLERGPRFRPDGYLTDYFTDQAVAAIEANRDRPFFLYLAHWAPHTPLQALKSDYDALAHIEDHRERVYAAMLVALDRGVGRVMQALRDQGLDDNTLVIFTSDNGGAGYVGLPEVNQPYRGWKLTFFEGGIKVPFFMRWPADIAPGGTVDQPVHHFDIYATAAAAAGATLPGRSHGRRRRPAAVAARRTQRGDPHSALFWRSGHYQTVREG
jgi:arylsulfatase A-like enzyme